MHIARVCLGGRQCEAGAIALNMSVRVAAGVEESMRSVIGKGSQYCGMLDRLPNFIV